MKRSAAGLPDLSAIRLVCATRQSNQDDFFTKTALGRSVATCYPDFPLHLFVGPKAGLPQVYNMAIEGAKTSDDVLVFVHDDVHLVDFFWMDEVLRGVEQFDIVGVVGNRRRVKRQPAWAFVDELLTWDQPENLSGRVGHGTGFPSLVSHYGPAPQQCLLLDGVFLAVRCAVLHRHGLRFDERFRFHFYDMDFCRQAECLGVTMGTWPIALVHESGGDIGSEGWQSGLAAYLEKWGE